MQKYVKVLAKYKIKHSKWPKTFKIVPKWRDFAKSGHTAVEGERNKGVAKTNTLKRRCKVLQR